jgi:hypothetical protein
MEQDLVPRWRLSGSVNWYRNNIDAFETILLFPSQRRFALTASKDKTWDFKINNRIQLPRGFELQWSYIYYAGRNVPQGRERARSSFDLSAKKPFLNERAEFQFTFTDIFNDFVLQHEIIGQGFRALYQNFLETQVASMGIRLRF